MPKRCLVCEREFPPEQTHCHQCRNLPLYDVTAPEGIQCIELNVIITLLMRRYSTAKKRASGELVGSGLRMTATSKV
jgi:hypothetical protein